MRAALVLLFSIVATVSAHAQPAQDAKIVIVPYPGDGGVDTPPIPAPVPVSTPAIAPAPVQPVAPPPSPQPVVEPAPAPPPPAPVPAPAPEPVFAPQPDAPRAFEAVPPPPAPPSEPPPNNEKLLSGEPVPEAGAGAMLDGHPREGAFLSGPGSLTFILHHSLMTGLGLLSTQMIPRAIEGALVMPQDSTKWTNADARGLYLLGALGGGALGFVSSAIWQFTHWMSHRTANFGIINSFFGGALLGGFTDAVSAKADPTVAESVSRAYAVTWMTAIGNSLGAWLTAIIGGGDLALNKGLLITSGGVWAGVYTALIVGIVASLGGLPSARGAMDAIMITPAFGAAAMALATLKFDPSVGQIMRANLFGASAGAAVLLISGLAMGPNPMAGNRWFSHFLPYLLSGVAAIGAKTIVSLLWVEAAAAPKATLTQQQRMLEVLW